MRPTFQPLDSFVTDFKQGLNCLNNPYKSVWISLQTFSSIQSSFEFVMSNGLGNPDRVTYRKFMFLKRNDPKAFDLINKELTKTEDYDYNKQEIRDYCNKIIMWSDDSLSFDLLMQKACNNFPLFPFVEIVDGVTEEFEAMQKFYPELFYKEDRG